MIAFTLELEPSNTMRYANLFAFLGLVLEIAGTFLGAFHSILLQKRVRNNTDSLNRITQFSADVKVILKWYRKKHSQDEQDAATARRRMGSMEVFSNIQNVSISGASFVVSSPTDPMNDSREDYKERLQRVESLLNQMHLYPFSRSQTYIVDAIMKIVHDLALPSQNPPSKHVTLHRASMDVNLKSFPAVVRPMFAYGNIPLYSMAIGVAFLAASTVLLSVASSDRIGSRVWEICLAVLLGVLVFSFLPLRYFRFPCHLVLLQCLKQ